jgi:myo-inositol-1-phosphate synthase
MITTPNNYKVPLVRVNSPNVVYSDTDISSTYTYNNTVVQKNNTGSITITPTEKIFNFRTKSKIGKVGLLMVGWGNYR